MTGSVLTRARLVDLLEAEGVYPGAYRVDGTRDDECLVLQADVHGWLVYYAERGLRSGERWFERKTRHVGSCSIGSSLIRATDAAHRCEHSTEWWSALVDGEGEVVEEFFGFATLAVAVSLFAWSLHRWAGGRFVPYGYGKPLPAMAGVLLILLLGLGSGFLTDALGSFRLAMLVTFALGVGGSELLRRHHNRGLSPSPGPS
jgi:hypothetical protein